VEGQTAFVPKGRPAEWRREPSRSSLRLLPAFDTYLLGYRSRELAVGQTLQRRLQRGGGWLHPSIVLDGRAIGAWTFQRRGRNQSIVVEGQRRSITSVRSQLRKEADDIGAFLETLFDLVFQPGTGGR
jgi:hypothetical protein